ncbi:uncharacterized protein LOC125657653 [Ostrea edulis]|uniref:uncharacterized protein LOC125657653 n=1 Tax=Ostrea edulis TaxID=37623 RepID=UPI0020948923|nr:uncharacterized protein LOC125657653 [Ostrea edulis]
MGGHCCRCCSFQERNDENIFDFIRSLSQLQPVENVGSVTSQASNSLESLGSPSWLSFEGEADNVIENVFIGDETTCFVCLENYNDRQNQPRIMPCGHIVCNQCLTGLAKTLLFTEIKCPQDRQVYKVKRRRRRGEEIQPPANSDNESLVQEDVQIVPDVQSLSIRRLSSSNSSTGGEIESLNSTIVSGEQFSLFANYQPSIPSRVTSISRSSTNAEYGSEKTEDSVPSFVESIWGSNSTATRKRHRDVHTENFYTNFYDEPLPDYPINSSDDEDSCI